MDEQLVSIHLKRAVEAYWSVATLATRTKGGAAMYSRAATPKVGDTVAALYHGHGFLRGYGTLTGTDRESDIHEIALAMHPGETVAMTNVRLIAVPHGDLHGSLLNNIDAVFQEQLKFNLRLKPRGES